MKELYKLTATDLVRRLSRKEITSELLVRALLARVQEREADVKAWVSLEESRVIEMARAIDRNGGAGPLWGLPLGFKDVIDTQDLPTQYNSPIYTGFRPRTDAACVALAKRAGGLIFGKTVTTEFACNWPGATRNPHNLQHTPGGSSSGSAAAVADFMVPVALGTQTGGSTIRPSAYCGVVGYKPSFGTINCAGMKHVAESLDTIGVIARTVEDCALVTHAIAGSEMPDFQAVSQPTKIGLLHTSRASLASADAHERLDAVAGILARHGVAIVNVELPSDFDDIYDEQPMISGFESARALAPEYMMQPDLLSEDLRKRVAKYLDFPRHEYTRVIEHARSCRLRFSKISKQFDALLTLSAPGEAPLGLKTTGNSIFNRNWTLLGGPCVTIPAGRGNNELPLGVQFVGCYGNDARILLISSWASRLIDLGMD